MFQRQQQILIAQYYQVFSLANTKLEMARAALHKRAICSRIAEKQGDASLLFGG